MPSICSASAKATQDAVTTDQPPTNFNDDHNSEPETEEIDTEFVPLWMNLDKVSWCLFMGMEYAKHRQDAIIKSGAVISSNDQFKISVSEIMDQFMMPDYSVINENGITYFIHCSNLVKSEDKSAMQDAIAREILKIYSIYVECMQSICIINIKNKNKDSVLL